GPVHHGCSNDLVRGGLELLDGTGLLRVPLLVPDSLITDRSSHGLHALGLVGRHEYPKARGSARWRLDIDPDALLEFLGGTLEVTEVRRLIIHGGHLLLEV